MEAFTRPLTPLISNQTLLMKCSWNIKGPYLIASLPKVALVGKHENTDEIDAQWQVQQFDSTIASYTF